MTMLNPFDSVVAESPEATIGVRAIAEATLIVVGRISLKSLLRRSFPELNHPGDRLLFPEVGNIKVKV
jgi:hypothetical protein